MNSRKVCLKAVCVGAVGGLILSAAASINTFAASGSVHLTNGRVRSSKPILKTTDNVGEGIHTRSLGSDKVRFNLEEAKNPQVTVISDREATYIDDGVKVNVKVNEDYYTDSTGKRVNGERARTLMRDFFQKNLSWVEVRYTSTSREVTGQGKEIIRLNNNDSDASLHWSKTESHTFSTELSYSGEFDLKIAKQKLGFDLAGSWTTSVTFTIDVGPRKAAILYLNPVGTRYTMLATQFSDYDTPSLIGSGKWTNWTGTEYKTVAY